MTPSANQSKRDLLLGLTSRFRIGLPHVAIGVPAFSIVGLLAAIAFSFTSIEVRHDVSARMVDLAAGYLTLLIVLERGAGGIVSLYYRRSLVDWTLRLSRINDVLGDPDAKVGVLRQVCAREYERVQQLKGAGFAKGITEIDRQSQERDEFRAYLTLVKHCYEFLHARVLSHINNVVSVIVGVAGFLLAASGMRLLEEILVHEARPFLQCSVLTVADVLLTGAFLGGGSATISGVVAQIKKMAASSPKPV